MIDSLTLKRLLLTTVFRKVIDLIPALSANDPQHIKRTCHFDIIKKFSARYGPLPDGETPERTKYATLYSGELRDYARWYELRARIAWGRAAQRDRLRSAWFYITAAKLSEMAGDMPQASNYYHFGACGFRELDTYRASIDYYIKAAELGSGAWVQRCLRRAYGAADAAGDDHEQARIKELLKRSLLQPDEKPRFQI